MRAVELDGVPTSVSAGRCWRCITGVAQGSVTTRVAADRQVKSPLEEQEMAEGEGPHKSP